MSHDPAYSANRKCVKHTHLPSCCYFVFHGVSDVGGVGGMGGAGDVTKREESQQEKAGFAQPRF